MTPNNDKTLKDKAIDIKGKQYVLVADRVVYFNDTYPNGSIIAQQMTDPLSPTIVMRATVTPDCDKPERVFTGYSQAVIGDGYINKTSALENAETSAVGRALAMMGIGVIESIASVDEIKKTTHYGQNTQNLPQATKAKAYAPRPVEKKTSYTSDDSAPFTDEEINKLNY